MEKYFILIIGHKQHHGYVSTCTLHYNHSPSLSLCGQTLPKRQQEKSEATVNMSCSASGASVQSQEQVSCGWSREVITASLII